jgi:hypothetical protein
MALLVLDIMQSAHGAACLPTSAVYNVHCHHHASFRQPLVSDKTVSAKLVSDIFH